MVQRLASALRAGEPVEPGIALCIATSGSTGEPKGALLSHAALEASARATMARIGRQDDDVWLSCLPWQHIGGLQVLLRARLFGTPLVVHDTFDPDRVAAETTATLVSLVPTQLHRLLDAGVDLARFRVVLLGGARAPDELLTRARQAGVNVVTTYGMSETSGGCVYDGAPLDGVDVAVDDEGHISLRGPMLMTGYRDRPDLTAEVLVDGWFRTSDLGRWEDGRLVVVGRADDVVVSGGENVPTAVVADLLASHPSVAEVAVTGVPDATWGERVVAVVRPAGPAPSLRELREWVERRAPVAFAPRGLVVVDELPLLPSGKLDRLAVARQATPTFSSANQSADPPSVA
jgi:o-succinylbenzoate---CoA ligase